MIELIKKNRPVVLVILDGWGYSREKRGNAVFLAQPKTFNYLQKNYPFTLLQASGRAVGLFPDQEGNSEAGHFNLGAGRIVLDDSVLISQEIKNKKFFKNKILIEVCQYVKKNKVALHLLGMIAERPTAHANPEHLINLIALAEKFKIKKIFLHLFTDGRDTSQHSALKAIKKIEKKINQAEIATLSGRFYAMDRKKTWVRTEKVYHLLTLGKGERADSFEEAISRAYNRGLTDEYIPPTIITKNHQPTTLIRENDAVIFFNLRSDRARQLTKPFVQKNFEKNNHHAFKRKKIFKKIFFVTLTDFGTHLDSVKTAYPAQKIKNSLPIVLAGLSQAYLAEKEKYAHITYFFSGGYNDSRGGEKRIFVPSPSVENYAQKPEMSADKVTDQVLKLIKEGNDFIAVNFANPDIIGHTGNLQAAIKAIKVVDGCLKKIVNLVDKETGLVIVTADHGNAEEMINLKTGEISVSHSKNPVPFILFSKRYKKLKLKEGILADVAPTILELLNIPQPKEMTGRSLIK
ncbi:MAG: 2,3-bisphosphoglycerate-independent phosphoglycerate mutase [Patescibacteria group bacterium]|nr:2,3-bisphosphoglycerate-independent phosphoglycerate mutase [Patescibacteria group bacterium]